MTDSLEPEPRTRAGASRRPSWSNALIVLPWLIGVVWMLYEACGYRDAATRQHTTSGIITAHDPGNHDRYGYSFCVGGRAYYGWDVPRNTEKWRIGQQVTVYYDATDPTTNSLRDFHPEFLEVIRPVPLLIVGITSTLMIIFFLRLRASPTNSSPPPAQ